MPCNASPAARTGKAEKNWILRVTWRPSYQTSQNDGLHGYHRQRSSRDTDKEASRYRTSVGHAPNWVERPEANLEQIQLSPQPCLCPNHGALPQLLTANPAPL